jgi:tellurite resistance protein
MGVSGLALAWREAHSRFAAPQLIGEAIGWLAIIMFAGLGLAYLVKLARHPWVCRAEFEHPISGSFFGTITISLLLLSAVIRPYSGPAATAVWVLGALATFAVAYMMVQRLLGGDHDPVHTGPPLLIPGVAALDIAVTGAAMSGPGAREANLAALAIGGVLAVVLFVLIVSRLRHHEPLPLGMTPALLVMVAPFEVGFLAYVNTVGRVDMFAALLFYFGLFLFLVLAPKVFRRKVPFGVPWWAVSFPMAALSIAALKYAAVADSIVIDGVAAAILIFLSVVIAVLFGRTAAILTNGRLLAGG